jgi:hypothetical protein
MWSGFFGVREYPWKKRVPASINSCSKLVVAYNRKITRHHGNVLTQMVYLIEDKSGKGCKAILGNGF